MAVKTIRETPPKEEVCRRGLMTRRSQWPWALWHVESIGDSNVQIIRTMNIATVFHRLRWSLLRIEERLLQAAGLDRQLGNFANCFVSVNNWNEPCPGRGNDNTDFMASVFWFYFQPFETFVCSSSLGSKRPRTPVGAPKWGGAGGTAIRILRQHFMDGST